MATFINTIDVLGDDAVIDSIIDRSITEFNDDTLERVGKYAFYYCTSLVSVNLPNVTTLGERAFSDCSALSTVELPNYTDAVSWEGAQFYQCTSLEKIKLPKLKSFANSFFLQVCRS